MFFAESHLEQVECLSVVRYTPGQMFKEHHDGAFRPKTGTLLLFFKHLSKKKMPENGNQRVIH
jgi:hypothetical protein